MALHTFLGKFIRMSFSEAVRNSGQNQRTLTNACLNYYIYLFFKCRYLKMINSLMLKSPGFWKMMEGTGMPFCVVVSAFYVGMGIVS